MIPGKPENHKWMGRDIFHPHDAHQLHAKAATYEFGDGLSQADAEDKAYKEYLHGRHVEAAAHHLRSMKAANAVGDSKTAARHSAMYVAHAQAIGGDPVGPVHDDISAHLKDKPGKHKFVGHKADSLIQSDVLKTESYRNGVTAVLRVLSKKV